MIKYTKADIKGGDILITKDGAKILYVKTYNSIKRRYQYQYIEIKKQQVGYIIPRQFDKEFDYYLRSKVYSQTDIVAVIEYGSQEAVYIEPQILDYQESEFLRSVIKPFRKRVAYIMLEPTSKPYDAYLSIHLYSNDKSSADEVIKLPNFTYTTIYQGLELNKPYTLSDLKL